jgi:hypothetical protein
VTGQTIVKQRNYLERIRMISRTALTFLTLALGLAPVTSLRLAAAQTPPAAQAAQDFSTPEATIRSFALAVTAKDLTGANCLVGATIDADLRLWAQDARRTKEGFQVTIVSVQTQEKGEGVTAAVAFDVKTGGRQKRLEQSLSLQKVGDAWKIVPPTEAELTDIYKMTTEDPPLLALFAGAYRHPKRFLAIRDTAREADCRSSVQELAQGTLTFTQDSDDKFDFRADAWRTAVKPYVKHEASFYCLSDETDRVSYTFNAQLQGKRVDSIRRPELTVLVYEGKKGVLVFRHKGRAAVGLANGKVRSVTPAEARTLRWAP